MTDADGTYSQLVELSKETPDRKKKELPRPSEPRIEAIAETPTEDDELATTPYISQNYRFTEDELKWLRRQSYNLTERFGAKVSQNTILRVALQRLRDLYTKNPKDNPLVESLSKLKK